MALPPPIGSDITEAEVEALAEAQQVTGQTIGNYNEVLKELEGRFNNTVTAIDAAETQADVTQALGSLSPEEAITDLGNLITENDQLAGTLEQDIEKKEQALGSLEPTKGKDELGEVEPDKTGYEPHKEFIRWIRATENWKTDFLRDMSKSSGNEAVDKGNAYGLALLHMVREIAKAINLLLKWLMEMLARNQLTKGIGETFLTTYQTLKNRIHVVEGAYKDVRKLEAQKEGLIEQRVEENAQLDGIEKQLQQQLEAVRKNINDPEFKDKETALQQRDDILKQLKNVEKQRDEINKPVKEIDNKIREVATKAFDKIKKLKFDDVAGMKGKLESQKTILEARVKEYKEKKKQGAPEANYYIDKYEEGLKNVTGKLELIKRLESGVENLTEKFQESAKPTEAAQLFEQHKGKEVTKDNEEKISLVTMKPSAPKPEEKSAVSKEESQAKKIEDSEEALVIIKQLDTVKEKIAELESKRDDLKKTLDGSPVSMDMMKPAEDLNATKMQIEALEKQQETLNQQLKDIELAAPAPSAPTSSTPVSTASSGSEPEDDAAELSAEEVADLEEKMTTELVSVGEKKPEVTELVTTAKKAQATNDLGTLEKTFDKALGSLSPEDKEKAKKMDFGSSRLYQDVMGKRMDPNNKEEISDGLLLLCLICMLLHKGVWALGKEVAKGIGKGAVELGKSAVALGKAVGNGVVGLGQWIDNKINNSMKVAPIPLVTVTKSEVKAEAKVEAGAASPSALLFTKTDPVRDKMKEKAQLSAELESVTNQLKSPDITEEKRVELTKQSIKIGEGIDRINKEIIALKAKPEEVKPKAEGEEPSSVIKKSEAPSSESGSPVPSAPPQTVDDLVVALEITGNRVDEEAKKTMELAGDSQDIYHVADPVRNKPIVTSFNDELRAKLAERKREVEPAPTGPETPENKGTKLKS